MIKFIFNYFTTKIRKQFSTKIRKPFSTNIQSMFFRPPRISHGPVPKEKSDLGRIPSTMTAGTSSGRWMLIGTSGPHTSKQARRKVVSTYVRLSGNTKRSCSPNSLVDTSQFEHSGGHHTVACAEDDGRTIGSYKGASNHSGSK